MPRILGSLGCALVALTVVACGATDETVASVNDEPISRETLDARVEQTQSLYEMQGIETNGDTGELESQVLDDLVTEVLLRQKAHQEGFKPSEEEVEAEYQQIAAQFADEEELRAQLSEHGLTPEGLREDIADQLAIRQYLEAQTAGADFEVTEEAVAELYAEYESQVEDVQPLEEVEGLLVEEAQNRERGQLIQQLIEDLKAQSDIEILL